MNYPFERYRLEVRPLEAEEGGGYLASIPDLPGCMGDGETVEQAVGDLREAFGAWVATAKERGRAIPAPGKPVSSKPFGVLIRFPRSLHEEVTRIANADGVSFNQWVITTLACAVGASIAGKSSSSWAEVANSYVQSAISVMNAFQVTTYPGVAIRAEGHDRITAAYTGPVATAFDEFRGGALHG